MNIRWLLLALLVSWVATCGQKGPLQLPDADSTTGNVVEAGPQRA